MSASRRAFKRHAPVPLAPEDFTASRTANGQEGPPPAKVRIGHYYGDMLHHREHDLYHSAPGAGDDLQNMIAVRLRAERFEEHEVIDWAFRRWHLWIGVGQTRRYNDGLDNRLCDLVVKGALAYRDTGMPADEAFSWFVRGAEAPEAAHLRNHGWNPWTHAELCTLCSQDSADGTSQVDEWVAAPIPSWRCLRYLQVGMQVPEAIYQEARRLGGEDIDAAIDVLLALRGAG